MFILSQGLVLSSQKGGLGDFGESVICEMVVGGMVREQALYHCSHLVNRSSPHFSVPAPSGALLRVRSPGKLLAWIPGDLPAALSWFPACAWSSSPRPQCGLLSEHTQGFFTIKPLFTLAHKDAGPASASLVGDAHVHARRLPRLPPPPVPPAPRCHSGH